MCENVGTWVFCHDRGTCKLIFVNCIFIFLLEWIVSGLLHVETQVFPHSATRVSKILKIHSCPHIFTFSGTHEKRENVWFLALKFSSKSPDFSSVFMCVFSCGLRVITGAVCHLCLFFVLCFCKGAFKGHATTECVNIKWPGQKFRSTAKWEEFLGVPYERIWKFWRLKFIICINDRINYLCTPFISKR